jgi:hypothetical protein
MIAFTLFFAKGSSEGYFQCIVIGESKVQRIPANHFIGHAERLNILYPMTLYHYIYSFYRIVCINIYLIYFCRSQMHFEKKNAFCPIFHQKII